MVVASIDDSPHSNAIDSMRTALDTSKSSRSLTLMCHVDVNADIYCVFTTPLIQFILGGCLLCLDFKSTH